MVPRHYDHCWLRRHGSRDCFGQVCRVYCNVGKIWRWGHSSPCVLAYFTSSHNPLPCCSSDSPLLPCILSDQIGILILAMPIAIIGSNFVTEYAVFANKKKNASASSGGASDDGVGASPLTTQNQVSDCGVLFSDLLFDYSVG